MDDSTIKREVKSNSEDDSNDVGCADVFGETVKSDNLDEAVLVKPELLAEVSKTDYLFVFFFKLYFSTDLLPIRNFQDRIVFISGAIIVFMEMFDQI